MSVNKIKQWAELGEFHCINDAARRVLELEGDYAINNFLLITVPYSDLPEGYFMRLLRSHWPFERE
jgi:hypothetical protein